MTEKIMKQTVKNRRGQSDKKHRKEELLKKRHKKEKNSEFQRKRKAESKE